MINHTYISTSSDRGIYGQMNQDPQMSESLIKYMNRMVINKRNFLVEFDSFFSFCVLY